MDVVRLKKTWQTRRGRSREIGGVVRKQPSVMRRLTRRAVLVVTRIEWLQRMTHAPGTIDFFIRGDIVLFVEKLQQFGERCGRVVRLAVAHTFADVADVQGIAGRHHRFKKEIAVFTARIAVTAAWLMQDLVQAGIVAGARKLTLVHADQADHAKRYRALRHQSAERHAAEQKRLTLRYGVKRAGQGFAHHAPRQRCIDADFDRLATQAGGEPAQRIQRAVLGIVAHVGKKQGVDTFQQPLAPCGQRSRCAESLARGA